MVLMQVPWPDWQLKDEGWCTSVPAAGDGAEYLRFPLAVGGAAGQQVSPDKEQVCLRLDELVLEGVAEAIGVEVFVPWLSLFEIEEESRRLLRLPEPQPLSASVRARATPASESFSIEVDVRHPDHGRLEGFVHRADNVYRVSASEVVAISPALHDLLVAVDEGVSVDISSPVPARMDFFERVRRKALTAGAALTGFLERESYVLPDDGVLTVDLASQDPREIELQAILAPAEGHSLEEESLADLNRRVASVRVSQPVVSGVGGDGRRTRAIFSREGIATVAEIRELRSVSGTDVPRFIETPEAFLPEGLDLSSFGKRVTGIGIRRASARPFLSVEPDGEKFSITAGLSLDSLDEISGRDKKVVGDRATEDLGELVRRARDDGSEYVFFGEQWVHVNLAELETFQQEVAQAREAGLGQRLSRAEARAVLEIFSNLENLDYSETSSDLVHRSLEGVEEGAVPYPVPQLLAADLLPHQRHGYAWLRLLEEHKRGGLLADDMGLGKTLQAIALLAAMKEGGRIAPSLVVVPSVVLQNWLEELARFAPDLNAVVHHGPDRMRDDAGIRRTVEQGDLLLTTYETLRRDQIPLARVGWQAIVLDEAQKIKNPSTGTATASRALKCERVRLALTGTPVENGLGELWAIYDFIQPGLLGSHAEFRENWERPIHQRSSDPESNSAADDALGQLKARLEGTYLRRLKEHELPGLPERHHRVAPVGFGKRQLALHESIRREAVGAERGAILGILQRLVQVCSHPALVEAELEVPSVSSLVADCPKFAHALDVLSDVAERGEGALVFTPYKRMQEFFVRAIHDRFGFWAARLNGNMKSAERQAVVREMNMGKGFRVLVISPLAGGVGLNITGANHVIHYTRLWNPAKEAQATDRVYRIGQELPVYVHYPIVESPNFETIEKRMNDLLHAKSVLARDVISPSAALNITTKELEDLIGA
jgi:superfamily II DNA or RNA helicase